MNANKAESMNTQPNSDAKAGQTQAKVKRRHTGQAKRSMQRRVGPVTSMLPTDAPTAAKSAAAQEANARSQLPSGHTQPATPKMNLEAFGPVHAVGPSNAPALEGRGLTKTAVQGAAQIHERLGVLVEVAALSVVAVASASRLDDAAFLSKRRDAAGKAGACLARIECSSRARVTSPPSAASPPPTISSARVDRSLQRTAWPGANRARAAKDRPSGFAIPRGQGQVQQPLVGMAITARCPPCSPGPGGREQLWIRRQELGDPPATGEAALLGESVQIHRPVMHGRFGKRQGAMAHFAPESAPLGYETTWPSDRRSADPLSKTERTP